MNRRIAFFSTIFALGIGIFTLPYLLNSDEASAAMRSPRCFIFDCFPTPTPTPTTPTPTPTTPTPTPTTPSPTPTPTTPTPTPTTPTPSTGPFVSTDPATGITALTATLNGRGDPRGSAATAWFRYGTTNPGTCNDTFGVRAPATGGTALGSGTGTYTSFSHSFTNLAPNTTYYFCAIGENSIAKGFGGIRSFTTSTETPPVPSLSNILRGSFAARDIRFAPIDLLIEYDPRIVLAPPPGFYGLYPTLLQEAY